MFGLGMPQMPVPSDKELGEGGTTPLFAIPASSDPTTSCKVKGKGKVPARNPRFESWLRQLSFHPYANQTTPAYFIMKWEAG